MIALAKRLGVPRTRIERLVKGQTALSADTAMRLATFFGTTPEFWMNLQRAWDLAYARKNVDVSGIEPLTKELECNLAAMDDFDHKPSAADVTSKNRSRLRL